MGTDSQAADGTAVGGDDRRGVILAKLATRIPAEDRSPGGWAARRR